MFDLRDHFRIEYVFESHNIIVLLGLVAEFALLNFRLFTLSGDGTLFELLEAKTEKFVDALAIEVCADLTFFIELPCTTISLESTSSLPSSSLSLHFSSLT